MSTVSIISFIVCIVIIILSLRSGIDVFSPGRAFAFMWSLAIGLTDLKLSGLQQIWPIEIWVQVLLGPVSFLIGVLITYIINLNREVIPLVDLRYSRQLWKIDKQKLFLAVTILFFLFFIGYILIYLKSGEIPLFSAKPGVARANFTMFGIGIASLNSLLPYKNFIISVGIKKIVSVRGRATRKSILYNNLLTVSHFEISS